MTENNLKFKNESSVDRSPNFATPLSANPINSKTDGVSSMNSMDSNNTATEKALAGASQANYDAISNIGFSEEETIEPQDEELDDTPANTTPQSKNNNVVNLTPPPANEKPTEAKPAAEITIDKNGLAIISPELQKEMDEVANSIRYTHGKGSVVLVKVGRQLIAMKSRLKHGTFAKWYESEFEWSPMTVKRHMDTARAWNDILKLEPEAKIEVIPQTLLYSFSKLSEAQQLEIAKAAKTGKKLKASNFKKEKDPSKQRSTDNTDAKTLAKKISGLLEKKTAMEIAKMPGFTDPMFGNILQQAISNSFTVASSGGNV